MDIATILGLIACFGLIVGSILVGGSLSSFIDVPSLLIVGGGTFGVALINYPLAKVLSAFKVAINVFTYNIPDPLEQNKQILEFAEAARKEGILVLESKLGSIEDDFLKRGLQLLVDGVEGEKIEDILYDEIAGISSRHKIGAQIFESLGAASPALGLVGTLIGLVQMLQAMDDPSSIGPAMAVALLTTFYGALFANVIFNPIAGKLRNRHGEEILTKQLIVKGLMGIANGENPRILGQQLAAELSPDQRTAEG
jgi:chemotaxis protein MotA